MSALIHHLLEGIRFRRTCTHCSGEESDSSWLCQGSKIVGGCSESNTGSSDAGNGKHDSMTEKEKGKERKSEQNILGVGRRSDVIHRIIPWIHQFHRSFLHQEAPVHQHIQGYDMKRVGEQLQLFKRHFQGNSGTIVPSIISQQRVASE